MATVSGEQSCGSAVNVSAKVGISLSSVSRNGNNVTIKFKAYMYQATSTWSSNSWVIWIGNDKYFVHTSSGSNRTTQGTKYYTPEYTYTAAVAGTSTNIVIGVNGNYWNPSSPAANFTFTVSGFDPAYTAPIPNLAISFSSPDVNTLVISKTSSKTTDLSSYRYTLKLYTNSAKTNLAATLTGTSLNDFPITWSQGVPGTTYYWTLDFGGTNSVNGSSVSMSQKSGSAATLTPSIPVTSFNWSASPLYNNHWTPRTVVSYTIGASSTSDSTAGLTFKNYEIQTAINSLTSNTKSHRVTALTGTMTLVDTNKWLRECKPRDLVYIKVRVCHVDNAGREYFSSWFGMTNTGQYIYNKFHLYLARPSTNEALRINTRAQFSGVNNEGYWNKGEVK